MSMTQIPYRRHDILLLHNNCRDDAYKTALEMNPSLPPDLLKKIIHAPIPPIVKMQEQMRDGLIEVGFSSPFFQNGTRTRAKSLIPLCGINDVITPFNAISRAPNLKHTHIRNALDALMHYAKQNAIDMGVYGSCALELITSLPYITPRSDIDLCVKGSIGDYLAFYPAACDIAQQYGVRFDIEALCANGDGVKLAELLSDQKTILCKGLYEIRLCEKTSLPLFES